MPTAPACSCNVNFDSTPASLCQRRKHDAENSGRAQSVCLAELSDESCVRQGTGLRLLTIEQAGRSTCSGFLTPIDSDQLKSAVASAIGERLGELDAIKQLPGFQRAAAASLSKSWSAGLTLEKEAECAAVQTARERLSSLAALEREVLSRLPSNQVPPRDLVEAASKRVQHAGTIFGCIEIHGRTECRQSGGLCCRTLQNIRMLSG